MSKVASNSWWSSLGFGKRAPAPDTDYADMGTAFGLDASMDTLPAPEANPVPSADAAGRVPQQGAGRLKAR